MRRGSASQGTWVREDAAYVGPGSKCNDAIKKRNSTRYSHASLI